MAFEDGSWRVGEACVMDAPVDLDASLLLAQVFSGVTGDDQNGLVAVYVLAHGLDEPAAVRAMNFFSNQPGLLVNLEELSEDAGADLPSLVNIRYSDDAKGVLATLFERDLIRDLPSDTCVSREGWDLFCVHDAISRGAPAPAADPLPVFDYRALRRKVYANRSSVEDDRSPWFTGELSRLRSLVEGAPDGAETFVAQIEDIESAISKSVPRDGTFAVVVPTIVERPVSVGAVLEWKRHVGRDVVVAHGLDAVQAARVLAEVTRDKEKYVSARALLSGQQGRESIGTPYVMGDGAISWITTDFAGRRDARAYENLRKIVAGQGHDGIDAANRRASQGR